MKKKKIKKVPRNTSALAAKSRKGGPMKDRREPRQGATNEFKELLCQNDDEKLAEELDNSSCSEEKNYEDEEHEFDF